MGRNAGSGPRTRWCRIVLVRTTMLRPLARCNRYRVNGRYHTFLDARGNSVIGFTAWKIEANQAACITNLSGIEHAVHAYQNPAALPVLSTAWKDGANEAARLSPRYQALQKYPVLGERSVCGRGRACPRRPVLSSGRTDSTEGPVGVSPVCSGCYLFAHFSRLPDQAQMGNFEVRKDPPRPDFI